MDVRGCFTALATAHMLGLDVQELGRLSSTPEYVQACQVPPHLILNLFFRLPS